MSRIVILGADTAGTIMANRLSRSFAPVKRDVQYLNAVIERVDTAGNRVELAGKPIVTIGTPSR